MRIDAHSRGAPPPVAARARFIERTATADGHPRRVRAGSAHHTHATVARAFSGGAATKCSAGNVERGAVRQSLA